MTDSSMVKTDKTVYLYCIRYKKNNKPVAIALVPDNSLLVDIDHDIRTCNYWWKKSDVETIFNICSQDKNFKEQYYIDTLTEVELGKVIGFSESEYLTKALEEFKKLGVIR